MPNKNKHINYSLADIEKYLQGKMDANEMHAIEKEALQNPFLADAIEGYRNASTKKSHQHLNEIEQIILNKKQETKIISIAYSTKWLWGIAASVLVVSFVSSIIWMLNNTGKSNKSISETKIPVIVKKDSAVVSLQKDSSIKINHSIIASNPSGKKKISATASTKADSTIMLVDENSFAMKDSITPKQDIVALSKKEYHLTNIEKSTQHESAVQIAQNYALTGKVAGVSVTNKIKNIEGRITDSKGNPIPNSSILFKNNRGISSDANGYFSLKAKDSVLNSTITALGYTAANTTLYNGRFNNISLKESSQSLNDVVVIGYGTQKKKSLTGSIASLSNNIDTLSPLGGWDKFKLYILNKISDSTAFHGNLEFEIELKNNGDIKDVSILQSPDDSLNMQIVEAIKNGPKWINTSSRKIVRKKLSINF